MGKYFSYFGESYRQGDRVGVYLDFTKADTNVHGGPSVYFYKNGVCQGLAYKHFNMGGYQFAAGLCGAKPPLKISVVKVTDAPPCFPTIVRFADFSFMFRF